MKKIIILIPVLLLCSCGKFEYNYVYTDYKVIYRTLSKENNNRYNVIENKIDNSLGEKLVNIHENLINYEGNKENQKNYDGNEFCEHYICLLSGEISNYVIFGDNITYYTIGSKDNMQNQFYSIINIKNESLQKQIDEIKISLKQIIGK